MTGFLPQEGCRYECSRSLMVVGRSVNGWISEEDPASFSNSDFRKEYAHEVRGDSFPQIDRPCPMEWVTKQWGSSKGYNTRRSAFWRVIKKVTEELRICKSGNEEWASHLVWSNLYKVSPSHGGNPNLSLRNIQRNGCKRIFEREIQSYHPKYLLLLTGKDWASPFLDHFEVDPREIGKYVQCLAHPKNSCCSNTKTVVAVHPQCKPEHDWVKEVICAYTWFFR